MRAHVIIDGFDTASIPHCILTDFDEGDCLSPVFTTNTVYGMNGTRREVESYDESQQTLTFHLRSFEQAALLVEKFEGLNKMIEFWHIPNSFYYYDCLSASIKASQMNSWTVSVKMALHPFRYLKNVGSMTLTANGTITNPGSIFSEPRIEVYGNGQTSLTIGEQIMRINLDTKAVIECRHGFQNIFDKNGAIKNSIRQSGPFFEIPAKKASGVVLGAGISRVIITPRWRNKV